MAGRGKFALLNAAARALPRSAGSGCGADEVGDALGDHMVGKLVLALGTLGMTEASATRRPAKP